MIKWPRSCVVAAPGALGALGAFGFAPPLMIETAIRYGVFDILDRGAKAIDALCAETGASLRVSYPAEEVTYAPVYGQ